MMKKLLLLSMIMGASLIGASAQSADRANDTVKRCILVTYNDNEDDNAEVLYIDCDREASFPGGNEAMQDFLAQNLRYPRGVDVTGNVYVRFTVREDGFLSDARVLRDLCADCGKEALRLVGIMPKWIPATRQGEPVATTVNIAISFSLHW